MTKAVLPTSWNATMEGEQENEDVLSLSIIPGVSGSCINTPNYWMRYSHPKIEAKVLQAEIAARNGGGTGFICNTDPVHGATGCACIEGETDAGSCTGMDRMCRVLGGNMTCDSEGFCACGGTLGAILQ
jgi:hypothetical protein